MSAKGLEKKGAAKLFHKLRRSVRKRVENAGMRKKYGPDFEKTDIGLLEVFGVSFPFYSPGPKYEYLRDNYWGKTYYGESSRKGSFARWSLVVFLLASGGLGVPWGPGPERPVVGEHPPDYACQLMSYDYHGVGVVASLR